MRSPLSRALVAGALAAAAAATSLPSGAGAAAPASRIDPWLESLLGRTPAGEQVRVIVNAETPEAAEVAAASAGLQVVDRIEGIAALLATGPPAAARAAADRPGVLLLEGADRPLVLHMDTSHFATRAEQARTEPSLLAPGGVPYDGTGIGIAVIDGGIDGNHPMFVDEAGTSKVKRNLEVLPGGQVVDDLDGDNDTDDVAGHGTHVAGTAAGYQRTTASGRVVRGAAPGATLYGLSVATAGSTYYGALTAQQWVMANHRQPCGPNRPDCAPIKVVNNSYGPPGGSTYNANSAIAQIQRATTAQGVTWVWAAGNDGGDGSASLTNGSGTAPTPGVISVAAYDDGGSGTRDGVTADFSSRGAKGDPTTWPDVAAPGVNIQSACRARFSDCATDALNDLDPDYGDLSGTSMASPHVAGYVAVLQQADPKLTPGDIEDVLEDTAHKYVGPTYAADPRNADDTSSFEAGHGLVDLAAALAEVRGVAAPPFVDRCAGRGAEATDPAGDATVITGIVNLPTPGLPTPDVDLVAARLHSIVGDDPASSATPRPQVPLARLILEVDDLGATPASAGDAVRVFFSSGGRSWILDANRDLATAGAPTATLSESVPNATDPTLPNDTVVRQRDLAVVFDAATDELRVDLPGQLIAVTAPGASLSGLNALWRRSGEAVALPADELTADCPLVATAADDGSPTPVVPEAPLPALLLVGAAGALAVVGLRRRRTA